MPVKPSEKEERYFLEQEAARFRKLHEQHLAETAQEERRKAKELHYLHCAKCGQKMETTFLGGVEVEICPDCGGVYLDAGELDRIIGGNAEQSRFTGALATIRRLWSK